MIRFHDIKVGDIVSADFGGQRFDGEVRDLNNDEKQINLHNGDQDDWFDAADVYAIPVDDAQLARFGFEKKINEDKTVKYMRGPFRILIPAEGDFNEFEIWYREDRRHISH